MIRTIWVGQKQVKRLTHTRAHIKNEQKTSVLILALNIYAICTRPRKTILLCELGCQKTISTKHVILSIARSARPQRIFGAPDVTRPRGFIFLKNSDLMLQTST